MARLRGLVGGGIFVDEQRKRGRSRKNGVAECDKQFMAGYSNTMEFQASSGRPCPLACEGGMRTSAARICKQQSASLCRKRIRMRTNYMSELRLPFLNSPANSKTFSLLTTQIYHRYPNRYILTQNTHTPPGYVRHCLFTRPCAATVRRGERSSSKAGALPSSSARDRHLHIHHQRETSTNNCMHRTAPPTTLLTTHQTIRKTMI
jgi:hypothetical protein